MYVMLDDFHDRVAKGLSGEVIAARLQQTLQKNIEDGVVNVFSAPPIDGLGTAGGFKIVVQDRGDTGLDGPAGDGRRRRRRRPQSARPQGSLHQFPGQYALAVPRYRSLGRQDDGRVDR